MPSSNSAGDDQLALGTRLKLLRLQKRLSAKALAEKINVSPSLISKIETGAANPSMDVLRKIVMQLHVNMTDLMEGEPLPQANVLGRRERGHVSVVRAHERRLLRLPQRGITYQMLSPDAQGLAELIWVELGPGDGGTEFFAHKTGEESLLVLEGVLTFEIGATLYSLSQGDCVTFDATQPHMYRNEGTEKVVYLMLDVPPIQ